MGTVYRKARAKEKCSGALCHCSALGGAIEYFDDSRSTSYRHSNDDRVLRSGASWWCHRKTSWYICAFGTVAVGPFQVVLLLPIVLATSGRIAMTRRVLRLTIVRTLLHIVGIAAMFTSLRCLPLADALAIAFVMLLLGKYVLNEEIGRFRLSACAVGFADTPLNYST